MALERRYSDLGVRGVEEAQSGCLLGRVVLLCVGADAGVNLNIVGFDS